MDYNAVVDYMKGIPVFVDIAVPLGLAGAVYALHGMRKLKKSILQEFEQERGVDSMVKDDAKPYSMSVRNQGFLEATRDYFNGKGVEAQTVNSYEVYDCDEGKVIITEDGTVNVRSVGVGAFNDLVSLMNRRHN